MSLPCHIFPSCRYWKLDTSIYQPHHQRRATPILDRNDTCIIASSTASSIPTTATASGSRSGASDSVKNVYANKKAVDSLVDVLRLYEPVSFLAASALQMSIATFWLRCSSQLYDLSYSGS